MPQAELPRSSIVGLGRRVVIRMLLAECRRIDAAESSDGSFAVCKTESVRCLYVRVEGAMLSQLLCEDSNEYLRYIVMYGEFKELLMLYISRVRSRDV